MNGRALAGWVALLLMPLSAGAVDPRQHSDSKQFSVFCEDVPLRMRVVSFAGEVKRDVLQLLGESDNAWKAPIVIVIEPESGAHLGEPVAKVRLSYRTHPNAKTSVRRSTGRPFACSGDI